MEPLQETREALALVHDDAGASPLLDALLTMGEAVRSVVPDSVGLSLSLVHERLTFTLVASDLDAAALDAAQYLDGGPCLRDEEDDGARIARMDDADAAEQWELYVRAGAARGIASSLSLPVVRDGAVVGGINLYAGTDDAFDGLVEELADVLEADAVSAVTNADLSFASRRRAAATPVRLRERRDVDTAVGMLAARYREPPADSRTRLTWAAGRAGLSEAVVARVVIDLHAG